MDLLILKIKMTDYHYLQKITVPNHKALEVFDIIKTLLKIQFKKDYFKTGNIGFYKNGLFVFTEYNFVTDQYGNLIDMSQTEVSFN
ncbi:hypothetical protein [Chryseobacterium sp. JUb7]|uniref:hypothetical protein n=1 Tax=Chryseobacterium sp. JUb7 TaxID=2940599 RepID=UPI0021687392|nr:hypothetical protein [Chryseobacterium sp. JUb7]MCS3530699.1 hypothetical protein [Chryseobacterium sp. JUb7]